MREKNPSSSPCIKVQKLRVVLPSGDILLEDFSLELFPGEVVVLLGGSGAGKSTFSRVLFEPEALLREGFALSARELEIDRDRLGLVPQRGALFDHLDVRGNIEIALRYAAKPASREEVRRWLERVGLDPALADKHTSVSALSGGQAQRVAVARALAGGRQVLFLDEPSVGLDPHRVNILARLIREQCEAGEIAAIVVTHDLALAAGVADRIYLLDPGTRQAEILFEGQWPGPLSALTVSPETRNLWMSRLEEALLRKLEAGEEALARRKPPPFRRLRLSGAGRSLAGLTAPFRVAAEALLAAPGQLVGRPKDFAVVALRIFRQTLFRPFLFYLVVSALIGYTVLYVISKVGGAEIPPDRLIWQLGGSYIVALSPVLSAFLFVAASGSAANAWLGSMGLTRQTLALSALGVSPRAYLRAPAWVALGLSYLAVAALFIAGMLLGGLALCHQLSIPEAWEILTADLWDPRPDRVRYLVRALFLLWIYAWGIASDVVARGSEEKKAADDVTRGMTGSVVFCTLWVVLWELCSAILVFAA